eukprot:5450566-Karenia_brevis.AAC.1
MAQQVKASPAFILAHPDLCLPTHVTKATTSGITWLELMLLSFACSDSPLLDVVTSSAAPLKTLARLLREFTTDALKFVNVLLPVHSQALFLTSFASPN